MSSDLDIKFPGIKYETSDQKLYEDLILEEWSPFKKYKRSDVFLFAVTYAYNKKLVPKELDSNRLTLPAPAFDKEMRTLMRSLAISITNDVAVIKNNKKVVNICEQYANASIKIIHQKIINKNPENTSEDILEYLIKDKS